MADKKMLIVRQKQKSRKPSKTRLSALYPVFLSGFEPLAFRLGGKIQPRPTVTYHILMYLFMSIFPCENLYPRVIVVYIA